MFPRRTHKHPRRDPERNYGRIHPAITDRLRVEQDGDQCARAAGEDVAGQDPSAPPPSEGT
jgi:hypothetical protein